jgi:hypothetical protein
LVPQHGSPECLFLSHCCRAARRIAYFVSLTRHAAILHIPFPLLLSRSQDRLFLSLTPHAIQGRSLIKSRVRSHVRSLVGSLVISLISSTCRSLSRWQTRRLQVHGINCRLARWIAHFFLLLTAFPTSFPSCPLIGLHFAFPGLLHGLLENPVYFFYISKVWW